MKTDILIVGGGLAGLSLADKLNSQGFDWQLIESRERLGGRILSPKVGGGVFDLGPSWFWPGQPRMAEMAQRFNLKVFSQYDSGDLVFQTQSGEIKPKFGYSSMSGSLRLENGMGGLIEALEGTLPSGNIHLNTKLSSLVKTDNEIIATAGEKTIFAKKVVLALPPRLIAESIKFEPALEKSKVEIMSNIPTWMAGHAKILAVYDKPYWRLKGFSGDAMSQRGPMVEIHDASAEKEGPFALFGFVGVPATGRDTYKTQLLEMAKQQLVMLFGSEMGDPIEIVMQDWAQQRFTATDKDKIPPNFHPAYGLPPELSRLWDDDLLLGSSEIGPNFGGFLEGALEASEILANNIYTMQRQIA